MKSESSRRKPSTTNVTATQVAKMTTWKQRSAQRPSNELGAAPSLERRFPDGVCLMSGVSAAGTESCEMLDAEMLFSWVGLSSGSCVLWELQEASENDGFSPVSMALT
mmetsp:Transcript_11366/g.26822  ORF Transcript_11366/g.26822 Transcript_11366/m.26822 type:complete len:108 (+) Transcript_11366:220-543(+)